MPYGTWITDSGTVIEVGYCAHDSHCSYEDAAKAGWIKTQEEEHPWFYMTYNPETVTRQALIVALERYQHSGKPLYLSDLDKGGQIAFDDPIHFLKKQIREKSCILSDVWRDRPCPTELG